MLVAVTLLMCSAPAPIVVVTQADDPDLVSQAEALRGALARDPRLVVAPRVVTPGPASVDRRESLKPVAEQLDRAQQDFARLEPEPAMASLKRLEEQLRQRLDEPGSSELLARTLRLKGLVEMFLGRQAAASSAFVSATFLDPDFSPSAEEWPPEARLAFADAIAAGRNSSRGVLSIDVKPPAARVWLDGREISAGSSTIRELRPGDHLLLATCPGYETFSAVVPVSGEGKLNHATVFLTAATGVTPGAGALLALSLAVGRSDEAAVARQALALLGAQTVLMVARGATAEPHRIWVWRANGQRDSGPLALTDPNQAAEQLASRLSGAFDEPRLPAPTPWYQRWYVWTAAGAAVVGGSIALIAVFRRQPERVDLVVQGSRQ